MALQDWESLRTGAKLGEGTVILLGAGASRHLGLPLADELLPEMFAYANEKDWELWGGKTAKKGLYELLTAIFPAFRGDNQREPGIEYFLSEIDVYQHFMAKGVMEKEDEVVDRHRRTLLQLLVDYLWNCMVTSSSALATSPYRRLLGCVSPKDTIISLNWDLACEWAFHVCGRAADWSYFAEKSKIPVLKLHGSINWRRKDPDFRPAHPEAFETLGPDISFWKDSISLGKSEEGSLSGILDDVPAIIPPSYFKVLESGTLRRVWRDAYDRLLACKRIIIVGSSLREEDRHLYSLFSLAFWNWKNAISLRKRKQVLLVGRKSVAEKFKRHIFPRCQVVASRFEDVRWDRRMVN